MNRTTTFPSFPFAHHTFVALILIVSLLSCRKNTSSSSSSKSSSSSGALLTEEVLVAANASGATVDSIVSNYQYDANNNLTGLQQSMTGYESDGMITTSLSYTMTYSGNVISSLTGTFNESATVSSETYTAAYQINTSFQSSNGQVVSYVQKTSSSGSPFIPPTQETGNDSALLTYNPNGSLATYTIYQINPSTNAYQLSIQESFSYSDSNLTQTVSNAYLGGVATDTYTTAYTYDTKLSAAPIFIAPGVMVPGVNDLTQSVQTETGTNPGSVTSSYTTTYNSANQPSSSKVTVTTTPPPTSPAASIATETITYTYQ